MSLVINNNLGAANVARTLTGHYNKLAKSVRRLSSGLRINSGADDAAGLGIREMMRAEIAAMRQGARNINDAISMLQIADGALAVIDEKLIRMKELAEQAATGTYNSTQRLMIDSEFQAMGAEINRIARATDFNGLKMLDGAGLSGKTTDAGAVTGKAMAAASRASVVGADGKTYSATATGTFSNTGNGIITSLTPAADLAQGITDPMALGVGKHTITLQCDAAGIVGSNGQYVLNFVEMGTVPPGSYNISYDANTKNWSMPGTPNVNVLTNRPDEALFFLGGNGIKVTVTDQNGNPTDLGESINYIYNPQDVYHPTYTATEGNLTPVGVQTTYDQTLQELTLDIDLGNTNTIQQKFAIGSNIPSDLSRVTYTVTVTAKDPAKPKPPTPPAPVTPTRPTAPVEVPPGAIKIHFGPGNDSAEDYYYINRQDCTLDGLGLAGVSVETQQKAQEALVSLDDAIVTKDKVRGYFGTMQNRLENSLTSLTIQAENLQAAESRLSDVDVTTEMANFVKNQILTQSGVAMLAQANSLPQMALQLLVG